MFHLFHLFHPHVKQKSPLQTERALLLYRAVLFMFRPHKESNVPAIHNISMAQEQLVQRFAIQHYLLDIDILWPLVINVDIESLTMTHLNYRTINRRTTDSILIRRWRYRVKTQ